MHEINAVIVDAVRSPTGRHRGGLAEVRPDDLLGYVLAALMRRTGVDPATVDDVICGCANQAGEDNRNVARMASLLAGFPHSVPAVTVNRLCASGLESIVQAARAIRLGDTDIMVAGGVESMSRAPFSMPKSATAYPNGNMTVFDTSLGWRYPNPRLEALFPLEQMGETAENLAEQFAVSREDQDRFALDSHRKAVEAQLAGAFDDEIVPIEIPVRKGPAQKVDRDEGPRADTSLDALAKLKPVFRKGGSVTAGNSSTLNDGACAVLLMSEDAAQKKGLKPLARIVGSAVAGVDPRIMGSGPIPAVRKLLERTGLGVDDIDLFELNEAFAAQSLVCIRELGLKPARVNINGGAIALGHPLGCSGARIVTTLAHALRRRGTKRGIASLCVGVGQGEALLIESM